MNSPCLTKRLLFPKNIAYLQGDEAFPASLKNSRMGCVVLLLIAFAVFGLFFLLVSLNMIVEYWSLNQEGVSATGQIVGLETDFDEGDLYFFVYRFQVQDQIYTDRQQVSRERYMQARLEDPLSIVYLPRDPAVSRIADAGSPWLGLFFLGFSVLWVSITSLMTYGTVERWLKIRRLVRYGHMITGELRQITGKLDGDNDYQVEVEVSFSDSDASTGATGRRHYIANDLKSASLPAPGTQVCVLYLSQTNWEIL